MTDSNRESIESILEKAQRAYGSNDLQRCESLCRQVALDDPARLQALLLIGFCCARTRRKEEAVRYFESALRVDSDLLEAHIALSTIYIGSGRIQEGILHGMKAIELEPGDPAPALGLAKQLAEKRHFKEAVTIWKSLVTRFPKNSNYLRNLAVTQGLARMRGDCVATWESVVLISPDSISDLLELGKAYLSDSQAQKAIATSESVLKRDRKSVDAHMLAAMALSEKGAAKMAEGHLVNVLEMEPDNPIAIASLGLSLQEQGRFGEAHIPLRQSIELWPSNGLAYYALIRSQKVSENDRSLLESIREQLRNTALDPLHSAYMHYALGKGLEDLEEFELSFDEYRQANHVAYEYWLAHRPWDRERYAYNFDRTIETFNRTGIASARLRDLVSERPLFVVGMIRSGTTLVEQILSSHPEICAAGEQTFWHEHAGRIFDPRSGTVNGDQLRLAAGEYLELLDEFSKTSARVTDKLPHNYALMGIIKAAIPGAKFIHIKRNALDNCLSIFTTAYQRPPAFTLDIGNIVFAYQQYERLMQHWRETMDGDDLMEIQYEDLVRDRESITREMIAFAGLEWSDACLSHEKNARSVHTPSTWQVRQPIYSSSVERWRRFEPWLGEFSALRA